MDQTVTAWKDHIKLKQIRWLTIFHLYLYMQGKPDLSSFGNVNEIEYGMGPDEPPTSVKIKEQFQRQILYIIWALKK